MNVMQVFEAVAARQLTPEQAAVMLVDMDNAAWKMRPWWLCLLLVVLALAID